MILLFRFLSSKRKSQKAKGIVIEELIASNGLIRTGRNLVLIALLALTIPLTAFLLLDFSSLMAAIGGAPDVAKTTYRFVPTYLVYEGAHPALSLELYSGALIEAKKFKQAHVYTEMLLEIRKSIYGKKHWMYGGMVANLGNLYYKEGRFKKAEQIYRQSIAICEAYQGYQKLGSAITRLGNCLREQGRYQEALATYEEALKMRKREFGEDSMRVAETTRELALLMTYLHKDKKSDKLFNQVQTIIKAHSKEKNTDTASIVGFGITSVIISFFLFGKRGLLTTCVEKRLARKIEAAGDSADPEDLAKLKLLQEYKENKENKSTRSKSRPDAPC